MDPQAPAPPLPAWVKNALKFNNGVVFVIPRRVLIRLEYIEFWLKHFYEEITSSDGLGIGSLAFHIYEPSEEVPIIENTFESQAAKDRFATLLQKIPIEGDQFNSFLFHGGYDDYGTSFFPDFWEALGHLKTRKLEFYLSHLTGEGQSSAFCKFLQTQDCPNQGDEEGQAFRGLQKLSFIGIVVDSEFKHHFGCALAHMTHLEEIHFKIYLEGEWGVHALYTDFAVPMLLSSAGSLRKIDMKALVIGPA